MNYQLVGDKIKETGVPSFQNTLSKTRWKGKKKRIRTKINVIYDSYDTLKISK